MYASLSVYLLVSPSICLPVLLFISLILSVRLTSCLSVYLSCLSVSLDYFVLADQTLGPNVRESQPPWRPVVLDSKLTRCPVNPMSKETEGHLIWWRSTKEAIFLVQHQTRNPDHLQTCPTFYTCSWHQTFQHLWNNFFRDLLRFCAYRRVCIMPLLSGMTWGCTILTFHRNYSYFRVRDPSLCMDRVMEVMEVKVPGLQTYITYIFYNP